MAFRKRSNYRNKKTTRRRYTRYMKRTRPIRVPRNMPRSVYMFKRHYDIGTVTLSPSAITTGGFSFQLDEVPNFTEFQELFDLYKIQAVKITAYPAWTLIGPTPVAVTTSVAPIRWASVIDYNSSGGFASFNDAREFQTCRVNRLTNAMTGSFKRYIYHPRFITGVEEDGSTIVAGGSSRGWLNTTRADVPHFGYRYIFEQVNDPANFYAEPTVKFEAIYYFMFKRVK